MKVIHRTHSGVAICSTSRNAIVCLGETQIMIDHADLAGVIGAFAKVLSQTKEDDETACTGTAAVWCPRCGNCRCPDDDDLNHPTCPLHGEASNHTKDEEIPT